MSYDLQTDADAARALFQSLDGMEGVPTRVATLPRTPAARAPAALAYARRVWPGFLVAATIALASTWLSQHYGAPVMLFALLFGMAFNFLHEEGACVAGIEFSSKTILRLGVALLGARITASQILSLGWVPIATVIVAVASTIALGVLVSRALGQSRLFGTLSAGAVAICGASAALAIATVLPKTPESERDTILTVVAVTALSTVAMILYPILATAVGLTHVQSGVFLGGTIHDVAQVVGAGYTISQQTGDIATYVKLLRVALLLPVVFSIAFVLSRGRAGAAGRAKVPVPTFLLGFAALVVLGSLVKLPKAAVDAAGEVSRWCLVAAIAALGMKTSFRALAAVGWRPVALMVVETAWILALVLGVVLATR